MDQDFWDMTLLNFYENLLPLWYLRPTRGISRALLHSCSMGTCLLALLGYVAAFVLRVSDNRVLGISIPP